MSIQTQVVWTEPENPETTAMITAKALEMGDLQASPPISENGPNANEKTYNRFWVDLTAAQEWINFINPLNPVSATILQ